MDVVFDTNVLVAGLRSSLGASHQILRLAQFPDTPFQYHLSAAIALEYEEILVRELVPTRFSREEIFAFLDDFICSAVRHASLEPIRPLSADADDDALLELAIGMGLDAVVTFNVRHFVVATRYDLAVLTPSQFLRIIQI